MPRERAEANYDLQVRLSMVHSTAPRTQGRTLMLRWTALEGESQCQWAERDGRGGDAYRNIARSATVRLLTYPGRELPR